MRAFKFRLEHVVRHRESVEQKRLQEFVEAQAACEESRRRLAALEAEAESAIRNRPAQLDVLDLARRESYLDGLKTMRSAECYTLQDLEERQEQARLALVKARAEREAIEILRKKAKEQFMRDALRAEQNAIDDLATTRHARAAREEAGRQPK